MSVATLTIYPGLGPARGSAGFCPVTFGFPVVWLTKRTKIVENVSVEIIYNVS